jgi:hypothetical protein
MCLMSIETRSSASSNLTATQLRTRREAVAKRGWSSLVSPGSRRFETWQTPLAFAAERKQMEVCAGSRRCKGWYRRGARRQGGNRRQLIEARARHHHQPFAKQASLLGWSAELCPDKKTRKAESWLLCKVGYCTGVCRLGHF